MLFIVNSVLLLLLLAWLLMIVVGLTIKGVVIPVPFTDLSATKKRPVLVVSNDTYNSSHPDMIVAAITLNLLQPGLSLTNSDMVTGQLPKPSLIRTDKIYTLSQLIVVKGIGQINNATLEDAKAEIIGYIS